MCTLTVRSSSAITSSTRRATSAVGVPLGSRSRAKKVSVSLTENTRRNGLSWVEYPHSRLKWVGRGLPFTMMLPPKPVFHRIAKQFSSVLFPHPDGPITATISPGAQRPETPWSNRSGSFLSVRTS